jgi:hypothetical protein
MSEIVSTVKKYEEKGLFGNLWGMWENNIRIKGS